MSWKSLSCHEKKEAAQLGGRPQSGNAVYLCTTVFFAYCKVIIMLVMQLWTGMVDICSNIIVIRSHMLREPRGVLAAKLPVDLEEKCCTYLSLPAEHFNWQKMIQKETLEQTWSRSLWDRRDRKEVAFLFEWASLPFQSGTAFVLYKPQNLTGPPKNWNW